MYDSTSTSHEELNNEEYTPQAQHLESSPVTKISPTNGLFPETTGAKAAFNQLCEQLNRPVQMVPKKDIAWSKKDPLHFWQSLAFTLRSEDLTCVAVSSFVDTLGENKLYIASNDPMTATQQLEVTEIINMFLDLKPINEIAVKLLPRQLSYIIRQFKKTLPFADDFSQDYPGDLANAVIKLSFKNISRNSLTVDDMRELLNLITDNESLLRELKKGSAQGILKRSEKMGYHLLKMIRVFDEIKYVWKKVKRHQQDKSLKSLVKQFQFISLNCHAELAILKTAKDCCVSKTVYIGVSKRPCYCCSLFFKAVEENKSTEFNISIVTTHGKLYGKWNRIDNVFEKEFNQVWAKVLEDNSALKK